MINSILHSVLGLGVNMESLNTHKIHGGINYKISNIITYYSYKNIFIKVHVYVLMKRLLIKLVTFLCTKCLLINQVNKFRE